MKKKLLELLFSNATVIVVMAGFMATYIVLDRIENKVDKIKRYIGMPN